MAEAQCKSGVFSLRPISNTDQKSVCVKNAELHLFHSTLEPNTEVFSKVSRSLAQMNSVSTLLSKGGMTCKRPSTSQDFCTHSKQQRGTATLSLACPTGTSEARVGRNIDRWNQSNTHFFSDALKHLQCSKSSSYLQGNCKHVPT